MKQAQIDKAWSGRIEQGLQLQVDAEFRMTNLHEGCKIVMKRTLYGVLMLAMVTGGTSCDVDTILNQTASFGTDGTFAPAGAPLTSGLRGTFRVFIENNTPFRAIFTYGSFDNTDERTTPAFFQFTPNSQIVAPGSSVTLEGNTNSGVVTFPCARVFSMGSRSLISLVQENPGTFATQIEQDGLIDGIGFSDIPPNADVAAQPNQGFAAGYEARLGADFNCGSLLVLSLEFNETGANRFRVNATVFPSRGDGQ